jgi:uncharacterized protein
MKVVSLVGAVALVLAIQVSCSAQDARNAVTVNGTGKVEAKADVAYVTLSVQGDGVLMTDAVEKARQNADQVVKAINEKHQGIKAISVEDFRVGQKDEDYYSPDRKETPRPEIMKRIRITLPPEPKLASDVIDTALRAGATMSMPSSFSYPDDVSGVLVYGLLAASDYEAQARQLAINDAKSKAEKLAALVGKTLGDVTSIQCAGSGSWAEAMCSNNRGADFPAKYVGLQPDKVEVSANLSVSYELVKK